MKNINEPFIEAKAQPIAKKSFLKKLKFSEALLILTLLILTILGSYPFISASRAAHMFTGSAAPKVLTGPEAVQKSINLDDVKSGELLMRSDDSINAAILLSTDVKIDIAGAVSRTIVSQRFINTSDKWAEGVYVFPIGENSAVDTLKMRIGDRFIEGKIKEKKVAKAAYEKAKEEGKKASLIEQQKPNLFTNTIANIGPGEIVTVQIEFQTKLSPDNGVWEMRVPLVSAPRYNPKSSFKQLFLSNFKIPKSFINAAYNEDTDVVLPDSKELINPVDISIDLKPGFEMEVLDSPYHEVSLQNITNSHKKIQTKGPVSSDRDFVLTWKAKENKVTASLFTEKQYDRDHFLLTLNPPLEIKNQKPTKREIIFVLDISGSMSGEPLRQA
ncbi:VIT and VWA domain-containing protein, partial [Planktomarina sp.]|nr:VIT and VWA domain-containing protein [Planktomarina sp.]